MLSNECPECGITYSEFKQTGRLGYSNCYSVFAVQLTPLIERIHGSSKYSGKRLSQSPETFDETYNFKIKYSRLRKELDNALKKEHYEQAAQLRDKLKEIKKDLKAEQKTI